MSNARLDRIEKLIEQSERANKSAHAVITRDHLRLRADLRRWAALGVMEARRQRKRAREIDENICRLVSAQLETEQAQKKTELALQKTELALQRFIEGRNGNGHTVRKG